MTLMALEWPVQRISPNLQLLQPPQTGQPHCQLRSNTDQQLQRHFQCRQCQQLRLWLQHNVQYAATLQQELTAGASHPAATLERQPRRASQSPAPAVARSGAAAISEPPTQGDVAGLHRRGRQAAKRAVTAIHDLFSSSPSPERPTAAKQARTSSQRSKQQQVVANIHRHVQQLSSNEMGLQCAAAGQLKSLAFRNKKNSCYIVAAGAVQPLVVLLDSRDSGCQAAAADALFNLLSDDDTARDEMLTAGGVLPLVRMLTSNSADCQIAAADLLAQLATTKDGAAAVLGTASSLEATVELLRNLDQDVVAAGLHLLIKLLSNRGDIFIAFSSVVSAVCEHLSSNGSAEVQLTAAETLAVMGDIDPSAVNGEMLEAAAATTVRLLDSRAYRTLEAAASIADIHPYLTALREAVPKMVAILRSKTSSNGSTLAQRRAVVREALRFLYNMAEDDSNLDRLAFADSLRPLIGCIQSPDALCEMSLGCALGAVYRLINEHPQRQQAAVAAGVTSATVELLLDHSDTVVLHNALAILWALAESGRLCSLVQTKVQSYQAVSSVVELLGHSDIRIQHLAAGLLMVLVKNSPAIKAEAVNAGAIPPLVQLLVKSDHSDVWEDVIAALESIADGSAENQAWAALATEGAVERLKALVTSDNRNVQQGAAAVLKLLEGSCG